MSSEFTNKLTFLGTYEDGVENCAFEVAQLTYDNISLHPDEYEKLEDEYKFIVTNLDEISVMKNFDEFYLEFHSEILIMKTKSMFISLKDVATQKRPLPLTFIQNLSKKYSKIYIEQIYVCDGFSTQLIFNDGEIVIIKNENVDVKNSSQESLLKLFLSKFF